MSIIVLKQTGFKSTNCPRILQLDVENEVFIGQTINLKIILNLLRTTNQNKIIVFWVYESVHYLFVLAILTVDCFRHVRVTFYWEFLHNLIDNYFSNCLPTECDSLPPYLLIVREIIWSIIFYLLLGESSSCVEFGNNLKHTMRALTLNFRSASRW